MKRISLAGNKLIHRLFSATSPDHYDLHAYYVSCLVYLVNSASNPKVLKIYDALRLRILFVCKQYHELEYFNLLDFVHSDMQPDRVINAALSPAIPLTSPAR